MAVIMEPRSRRRLLMAPPLLNRYTSPVFSHRSHFLMNREGQTDDVGAVCLTRSESRKSPFWFVDDSECRLGRGRWCESRRFHLEWGALQLNHSYSQALSHLNICEYLSKYADLFFCNYITLAAVLKNSL